MLSRFVEIDDRYNDFRHTRSKIESIDGFLSCYKVSKGSLIRIIGKQRINRRKRRNPLGSHCTGNMGPYSKVIYAKSCGKGTFTHPEASLPITLSSIDNIVFFNIIGRHTRSSA